MASTLTPPDGSVFSCRWENPNFVYDRPKPNGNAGADVVQCYVGAPAQTAEPPRQLRGFTRVELLPGQSQAVHLVVSPGDLAAWDSAHSTWTVAGGTYHFFVGDASDLAHLPLRGQLHVAATSLGADSGPAPAF